VRTIGEYSDKVSEAVRWVKGERNGWIKQHRGRKRTPRGMTPKLITDAAAHFDVSEDAIQSALKN
jgi:hypothetical protein